jgi:hypothetical protein
MGTMNNALIANGGQFAPTASSYIANVQDGGQLGFGPLLANLDANTPPVYLPLQIIVTHVPTIFSYIPNGVEIFKSLFETHMVSMDGLDFNYSMETDGTPVGRDGQQQMVPTKQVRSQISPTCMWPEKIGNLVFNLGRVWMNAMHDPDTQAASMAGIIASGTTLPPLVASMYAADLLCIQYDTTMRPENIIDAFALTNFFPTEIGSPGYQYNATETHRPDRSFTFTSIVQHNNNTMAVAQSVASLLNLHEINFQDALPVASSIDSQISGDGIQYNISQYFSTFANQNGTTAV